ncbi:ECF transporter S component [Clostridium sp. MSJ-11]|uniref:ECF transporter S component n=1 Tax=Clostridium mobile TaxID=2841512 RepID=A0ABS6EK66_9CLOT|nr:ECF transporter S component [Clostridium mobile]MBU5485613.1 ECF transporter S component [Clostridium mobile]
MKKKIKLGPIIIIFYTIMLLSMTYFEFPLERAVEISALFIIGTVIVLFENKEINGRTMAALATMSALGGVLRVPFAAIPGFQPVTFICAVTGYTLGPVNGFMVGAMSAFISNFFLGHGPWTPWQMLGWGLCGVFFGVFKNKISKCGINGFVIICAAWGYIYGTILNQWYVLEFMRPITLKTILAGNILSFSHDTLHAVGNAIFAKFFGESFIEALERYNKRNKVIRIKNETIENKSL